MVVVLFLTFLLQALAFGDCSFCDNTCGNWSCITNCSSSSPPDNPTFDTYRCAVDGNGNNNIDDCSELLACVNMNSKWVCPTDTGDSLCTSPDWQGPYPYDSDPADPSANIWGFYITTNLINYNTYTQLLSQYSLTCPQAPSSSSDRLYQYAQSQSAFPVWVCGGALYSDAWLSYGTCSYISYDGYSWKVKNGDCTNPNKIWQKLGQKCYGTQWSHYIYVNSLSQSLTLFWNVGSSPQCGWQSSQTVSVGGQNYTVKMSCVNCSQVQDAQSGQTLSLCSAFQESVYDPSGSLVYTLWWYPDSSWSCPVSGGSQSSPYTYESMTPTATATFTGVSEERQNNASLRGVGVDTQGTRCRICSTSMSGLSGGVVKEVNIPNTQTDWDKLAQCVNPRFFSGEVRTCRPGGLTTLGATCCGISGWTKNMCKKDEKELKKKRQAYICHEVGDYCSKKILGVCLEKKRSFCCFHSQLARIFNECGRPQVGKGWGSPKNPDCSGFSIDEFSRIDFSTPECMQAIEEWANRMAQGIEDKVSTDIVGRATSAVERWINNVKNQNEYGGEK